MMHDAPWFLGNSRPFTYSWLGTWNFGSWIVPLAIWSLIWTGLALWHAAGRKDKWWFILFLLVHTAGIVEIVYLVFVAHAFEKKRSRR